MVNEKLPYNKLTSDKKEQLIKIYYTRRELDFLQISNLLSSMMALQMVLKM